MNPLELMYYTGYSLKKSHDLRNQRKLPHRVISVGNITTGGTGKTPAVIALAGKAKEYGYQPCILTRGYMGKKKGPCFISKGTGALLDADEAGDEPVLMAQRLKGVPIVKGKDRYEAGMFAIDEFKSIQHSAFKIQKLLFILDDGFQHWRLHRDLDILLIDGTNPFGNGKLLPSGILREPLNEIRRSDVIALTRHTPGAAVEPVINEIKKYNTSAPVFVSGHRPKCLKTISGAELPLNALNGKKVLGFCGIGNPGSFKKTLVDINADLRDFIIFRDHYKYNLNNISAVKRAAERVNADWIVTTEKDIMKLSKSDVPENLVFLEIEFMADKEFYERVLAEV